jgi:hypothetical protein
MRRGVLRYLPHFYRFLVADMGKVPHNSEPHKREIRLGVRSSQPGPRRRKDGGMHRSNGQVSEPEIRGNNFIEEDYSLVITDEIKFE